MHIGGEKKIFQLFTKPVFCLPSQEKAVVDVRFGQQVAAKLLVEDVAVKSVKNEGEGTLETDNNSNRNCFFDAEEFVKEYSSKWWVYHGTSKTSP